MSDKPKSTNPSNWHPAMNLNQEVYYAKDIDPFFFAYDKLEAELAASRKAGDAALKAYGHTRKELAEARAEIDRLKKVLEFPVVHSRDVLLDKCEKALELIESGESTYYEKSNGVNTCYELARELLAELKSRRGKCNI